MSTLKNKDKKRNQNQSRDDPLDGLQESARLLSRAWNKRSIRLERIVYNVKSWEEDRVTQMDRFLRASRSWLLRSAKEVRGLLEALGTLEGSGCAFVNVLKELVGIGGPALGLLVAGEGSRLWGVSGSLGFIKGLSAVLGSTLIEQTVRQALLLFAQAPRGDLVIVAGTDNVFLPASCPLRVASRDGTAFSEARHGHLFFFSKEQVVLDAQGQVTDPAGLEALTQLGIMLVDEAGRPELFLEKVSTARILEVLRQRGRRSVFFNTFYFAMSPEAAALLTRLYSERTADGQRALYEVNGFDWSTHVLEPLCGVEEAAWEVRRAAAGPMFAARDWVRLRELALEFRQRLGPPLVVNLGRGAVWYDTGLSADLLALHDLAVAPERRLAGLLRGLFELPPPGRDLLRVRGPRPPRLDAAPGRVLVLDACFCRGGSVGEGAVVINSIFEQETHVPPGVVVINSHLHSLDASALAGGRALVYSVREPDAPLRLLKDAVHFSVFIKPERAAAVGARPVETGVFPLRVVPKNAGRDVLLGHYNAGANQDKPYLVQSLLGFSVPLSFRDLQQQRLLSLESTIRFLHSLPAHTTSGKAKL
jgi:hypothetical protein